MDPHPPPPAPFPTAPAAGRPGPAQRPGGLVAILVLAVVLGGGGACAGATGIGGALLQSSMGAFQEQLLAGSGGMPGAELQLELQKELLGIQEAWLPWQLADASLRLLTSVLLLVGAILSFSYRERGRRLLLAAMGLGLVFGVASTAVGLKMQHEVMSATFGTLAELGPSAGAPAPPGLAQTMGAVGDVATFAMVAFALGWLLVKCAFFAVSAWYLRRPGVRALFGAEP